MHDLSPPKYDAIGWVARGAGKALLPLVPPEWIANLKREQLDYIRQQRPHMRHRLWESEVNMGQAFGEVQVISANGEIGFHRDQGFPRYGYLLILRASGYNVTGPRVWRGLDAPHLAGDLICLKQQTHLHALTQCGTERRDSGYLAEDWGGVWAERPQRLWIAATLSTSKFLTPEAAVSRYLETLNSIPINRYKKNDVEC
ncbi:hypothetical protein BAMBUS_02040 [Brevundimonas phage vB_BpoS-Bambus]|nr:hypothetical protein BAMBUS_02040 [Brevundimonas phage vB_BpoS-Bambus]